MVHFIEIVRSQLTKSPAIVMAGLCAVAGGSVIAYAQVSPSALPPAEVTNGLSTPSSSQDFFQDGNSQFEGEIIRLQQGRSPFRDSILRVNGDPEEWRNEWIMQSESWRIQRSTEAEISGGDRLN